MKRFVGALVMIAIVSSGVCWAISSEPVYIKGPDAVQAFKARLDKLQKLVNANADLFDGLGDFAGALDNEAVRLTDLKRGTDPGRIEITKVYRSLDAVGRKLTSKRTPAASEIQSMIRDSLDWIEAQNSLKGLTRGW